MILVHTHPSTAYNFSLLVYQYICVCLYVFVYVCTVTEFWILTAALNFGPFKTISVTTYTVASSLLSIWKGDTSGVCTSCQPMILIKNVQASKTTKTKNKKNKKKQKTK